MKVTESMKQRFQDVWVNRFKGYSLPDRMLHECLEEALRGPRSYGEMVSDLFSKGAGGCLCVTAEEAEIFKKGSGGPERRKKQRRAERMVVTRIAGITRQAIFTRWELGREGPTRYQTICTRDGDRRKINA